MLPWRRLHPLARFRNRLKSPREHGLAKINQILDDPEVSFLRFQQASLRLYNTATRTFETLPELLRPGQPLYDADVVCVGEVHDSESDHVIQRLILDALTYKHFAEVHTDNLAPKQVAVGVEYFTRQQQTALDELIYGQCEKSGNYFRETCDWDATWQYEWALYAPLFRFCQLNPTRIIGLNIPFEVAHMVAHGGIESVPSWLQELLPEMDLSQRQHRRRFEDTLRMQNAHRERAQPHPGLDHAYTAQVLWDEYMADSAHQYLSVNQGRLVLLAGTNHVWRDAIPDRFERRSASSANPQRAVSILPWHGSTEPAGLPRLADYILCMRGPGGGNEIASTITAQRHRLAGKSRLFPAGYI